jgi:hypothetical protein
MVTVAAIAVIALAGLEGKAKADFIVQTFSHSSQPVPYSFSFGASQFDPSMGTLNSVSIAVVSDVTGEVDVINLTGVTQTFTNASASIPVTLAGPASLSLSATAVTPAQSGTVAAGIPYGETVISGLTATASTSVTYTAPAALATYIGTGTSNLPFLFTIGNGTYSGTAPPNVFFSGGGSADATVTITYNFSPVPEPAGFVLLGLGSAIGLIGRRALRRRM